MRGKAKDAFDELVVFASDYSLNQVMKRTELKRLMKDGFKKYYPLLILEKSVMEQAPWTDAARVSSFRLYLKEVVSDHCQAYILAMQGFYKPALLMLRSGLENFLRCIGLAQDQAVLSLKSVFELFDLIKTTPFIKRNKIAKALFEILQNDYKILCGYVHTASAAHMALNTLAGEFPKFKKTDAERVFKIFNKVSRNICALLCLLIKENFKKLHHTQYDMVCDILSVKVKRHLTVSS